jgi:YVTN family beta-propeller protein
VLLVLGTLGATACKQPLPLSGSQLYSSPQTNPIVVSEDGAYLLVANTTSGTVSLYARERLFQGATLRAGRALLAEIPVGHDPVAIAQRPGSSHFWVANHISDTLSVIDVETRDVVDTIQELDAGGVATSDAPTGIAFSSPTRAFVTLDDRNEVLVVDTQPDGSLPVISARLAIPAQAPRAVATMGGKVYVAAFESENQTEFPTCGPFDPRLPVNGGIGLDESDPWDEGCEFASQIIDGVNVPSIDFSEIELDLGLIFDFAAVNPNVGGRVIIDRDRPDRDLFVFDAGTLALEQVIEHVGTLLYGLHAGSGRVYVTQTDARNHLEGLTALDNRMFDNRLAWLDCNGACGVPTQVDLEANPFGVPVPTPYGIRGSADGQTLVVSVAGSDGVPGLHSDPAVDIPGLVVLDAQGAMLGQLQTGAIPQGVALHSDAAGAAETAYVLNTVDSSVSVVDVSNPAAPALLGTFPVGDDPTPPQIRLGRTLFQSARASSKGTFSCESCHPNANIDQLLWVINSNDGPNDVPDCDPYLEACPEPRTTMPIRGLRDTLPLHWLGNLGDPFPNLPGQLFQPEDAISLDPQVSAAPDCDLSVDGEIGCARRLSDASLSGVMCDQDPSCAVGPSGLPGALTDEERDALAAFMMSVSFPPSPKRAPTDALSATALQGVQDFFTDDDGLGIAGGIGETLGFAPITCADNSGGCHALPLTASTNSLTVGGFEAPSMRGMWDRFLIFSNGNVSSQEWLEQAQACADGNPPVGHTNIVVFNQPILDPVDAAALLTGDPCALGSQFLGGGFDLDPFPGQPSGEQIYDPAVGMTERGHFLGSFEAIFHLAYGVRGAAMWEYFSEMSVGLPGLTGQQISITPANHQDPGLVARMDLLEQYAQEGRVTAVARNRLLGEYRWDGGWWRPRLADLPALTGAELRARAAQLDGVYTITADLPANVSIGGADRQPLLDIDPDAKDLEMSEKIDNGINTLLAIPEPGLGGGDTIRLGAWYVDPAASVIVDGALCGACSFTPGVAANGAAVIDLVLALPLAEGPHVVQVLNPNGWMSNEMPVMARP